MPESRALVVPGVQHHAVQPIACKYGNLKTEIPKHKWQRSEKHCIFSRCQPFRLLLMAVRVGPGPSKIGQYILFGTTLEKEQQMLVRKYDTDHRVKAAALI